MSFDFYQMPDGDEIRAWLEAEKTAVARQADMILAWRKSDPARAAQLQVMVRRRVKELLDIEEWLDLR